MKKIFKYVPIILGLVMVMSSCGDDDETEPVAAVVNPTLVVSVNGSQIASGATIDVLTNSTVTLAITANKVGNGRDLDVMSITQSGPNSATPFNIQAGANDPYNFADGTGQTLKGDDDETFTGTGVFTSITGNTGSTAYNVTVTDKEGKSTSVTFSIVVADPVVSTAFTVNKTGSINHIEGRGIGSWNLATDTTVAKSMSTTMADIRNTNTAGDPFTGAFRVGTSRTTTDFVVAAATYDYDAADVEGATAAYSAGAKVTTATPTVGSVYIFSVNGTITLVKVTEIDASFNGGSWVGNLGKMTFTYKR